MRLVSIRIKFEGGLTETCSSTGFQERPIKFHGDLFLTATIGMVRDSIYFPFKILRMSEIQITHELHNSVTVIFFNLVMRIRHKLLCSPRLRFFISKLKLRFKTLFTEWLHNVLIYTALDCFCNLVTFSFGRYKNERSFTKFLIRTNAF